MRTGRGERTEKGNGSEARKVKGAIVHIKDEEEGIRRDKSEGKEASCEIWASTGRERHLEVAVQASEVVTRTLAEHRGAHTPRTRRPGQHYSGAPEGRGGVIQHRETNERGRGREIIDQNNAN